MSGLLREAKSFDRLLALSDLLEEQLGRTVEVVTTEALSPFIGPRILAEAQDVPPSRVTSSATSSRDRLIHDYFGVDYEIVWDVVQNRIPELRRQIVSILEA